MENKLEKSFSFNNHFEFHGDISLPDINKSEVDIPFPNLTLESAPPVNEAPKPSLDSPLSEYHFTLRSTILKNKLLLKYILQFFAISELKELRNVNRFWNKTAKLILTTEPIFKYNDVVAVPSDLKHGGRWAHESAEIIENLYNYRRNIDALNIKTPIYSFIWTRVRQFTNLTTLNVGPMLFLEGPVMNITDLKRYFPRLVNYSITHPDYNKRDSGLYPTPQFYYCSGLQSLELNWIEHVWNNYMKRVVKINPQLKRLSLNRITLPFSLIKDICSELTGLESLEVDITMSSSRIGDLESVSQAFNSLHSAPEISLVTPQSSASHFKFTWENVHNIDTTLAVIIASNPNLNTFKFKYSLQIGAALNSLYLFNPLNKTSLTLHKVRFHPDIIKAVFKNCTNLVHVELSECNKVTDFDVEILTTHCPNIKNLILKDSCFFGANLTSKSLDHIRKNCSNLRHLFAHFQTDSFEPLRAPWKCKNTLISLNLFKCPYDYEYFSQFSKFEQLEIISFLVTLPTEYAQNLYKTLPNVMVSTCKDETSWR